MYSETRYFTSGECPERSGAFHVSAITVTSGAPITMISPTIRAEDTAPCPCNGRGTAPHETPE